MIVDLTRVTLRRGVSPRFAGRRFRRVNGMATNGKGHTNSVAHSEDVAAAEVAAPPRPCPVGCKG